LSTSALAVVEMFVSRFENNLIRYAIWDSNAASSFVHCWRISDLLLFDIVKHGGCCYVVSKGTYKFKFFITQTLQIMACSS
jgi:hypothetical protein